MSFKEFLKEKIFSVVLLIFGIITIEIFLLIYEVGMFIKLYIPIIILLLYFIGIIIEYGIKKSFYQKILSNLMALDDKFLITELVDNCSFIEGKILKEILRDSNKSMLENVNKYKHLQEEYKEYIELWIHEVKLPITSSKMLIENNRNNITNSIEEELNKIDSYIEQALFYARSNTVEKDYYIRRVGLKGIIYETLKNNKKGLIKNNIKIDLLNIDEIVYADVKWTVFILNQIISNCIKYSDKENKNIIIFSEKSQNKVFLHIKDNGLGVKKEEIKNVFEKGFTGTNGRLINKNSTGIGLYLCRKLCDKLGLGLKLNSIEGIETELILIFPQDSYLTDIK